MVCENIQYIYYKWYDIFIYSIYIFPGWWLIKRNPDFAHSWKMGLPNPENADEGISFFFGALEKISGIFQRQRIYGGEGNTLRCPLLSRDLLNKKLGITGQHIPWTGSLVIHPLDKVIYLFQSIETWIEKWPNIFLKNTETNHIIYSCFVMSNKAYHQKENDELSWGHHSSVWFPPAIDHFTIWVCPPM